MKNFILGCHNRATLASFRDHDKFDKIAWSGGTFLLLLDLPVHIPFLHFVNFNSFMSSNLTFHAGLRQAS